MYPRGGEFAKLVQQREGGVRGDIHDAALPCVPCR